MIDIIRYLFQAILQLFFPTSMKMSNSINIFVKSNEGSTLPVELDPKWDIRNLKERVAPQLGLTAEDIKIIFAGKELMDSIVLEECDLGQQSILHAVKIKHGRRTHQFQNQTDSKGSRPMNETLVDWQQLEVEEYSKSSTAGGSCSTRAHFYVYCPSPCKTMKPGKLRVRCALCGDGAFTVNKDPQCWEDVLLKKRITGTCENNSMEGSHDRNSPSFAEFYFKCSDHISQGEADQAVPLDLIKANVKDIPCLACTEARNPVLVFPCQEGHVTCLDCFRMYCLSRLRDRQFWSHPDLGYTLPCPAGCADSLIKEVHHFRLLTDEEYGLYQRFGAEEFVLQAGGVFCPQPGCGMGILAPSDCRRIQCLSGCEFVFCRECRQGYHLGDCNDMVQQTASSSENCQYHVDPFNASQARWDEATKVAIQVTTKPCPKCRTPTERSGGCMHMICTRPHCGFHWCWVCQSEWSRDCMGNHWFG